MQYLLFLPPDASFLLRLTLHHPKTKRGETLVSVHWKLASEFEGSIKNKASSVHGIQATEVSFSALW